METLKQNFLIAFCGLSLAVGPIGFFAAIATADWRYLLALPYSYFMFRALVQ